MVGLPPPTGILTVLEVSGLGDSISAHGVLWSVQHGSGPTGVHANGHFNPLRLLLSHLHNTMRILYT